MKYHLLGIVALLFFFANVQAYGETLYKWTDENGKVHYSNGPPMKAKSVEKHNYSSRSTSTTSSSKQSAEQSYDNDRETYSNTTKPKKKRTTTNKKKKKQDMNAICRVALKEGHSTIKSHLKVMKDNVDNGYMPKEKYKQVKKAFLQIKRNMTLNDCLYSKGREKKFYICLSRTYGDVVACGPDS